MHTSLLIVLIVVAALIFSADYLLTKQHNPIIALARFNPNLVAGGPVRFLLTRSSLYLNTLALAVGY